MKQSRNSFRPTLQDNQKKKKGPTLFGEGGVFGQREKGPKRESIGFVKKIEIRYSETRDFNHLGVF